MKTKLILFLLCLSSLCVMGQGVIPREKCKTCGKVISQCSYKGKHPMKTCSTCGKVISQCQYKGKHPEKTCGTCGKVISQCQYKGKHPEKTCGTCGKVISQCQYKGSHPAPEPSGYDVSFTCNVPDAALVIDGRNYGNPIGSVYLKSGPHTVSLQADEYEEYCDSICVDSEHRSFSFAMQKSVKTTVVEIYSASQSGSIYDEINEVTLDDVNTAHEKSTIQSATINGKTFFYATIPNKSNLAVIVAKKGAYDKMTEVILPESFLSRDGQTMYIVGIGYQAFQKCKKIRRVILPNTMRYIGAAAFSMCGVEDLSLNEGLLGIDIGAFVKNDIMDISLPESIVEVGELAFYAFKSTIFENRGSKGKLYIPKTISKIGKHAFSMTRNGYGAWFHSKREILSLPDFVDLDNCKDYGINKDVMEEYLSK